jgi:hypothetical protein
VRSARLGAIIGADDPVTQAGATRRAKRSELVLIIRAEQFDALREDYHSRLVDRLASRLRGQLTEETKPIEDEELRRIIRKGIGKATTYGIEVEVEMGLFCEGMVRFGEDYDEDPRTPWVHTIFLSRELAALPRLVFVLGELEDMAAEAGSPPDHPDKANWTA